MTRSERAACVAQYSTSLNLEARIRLHRRYDGTGRDIYDFRLGPPYFPVVAAGP